MKLVYTLHSLCAVITMMAAVFAEADISKCNQNMYDVTTCMGMNDCFSCLNEEQERASTASDPANRLCNAYICPIINETSCCPLCESHALAVRTCIVDESDTEAVRSGSVCSCGMSGSDDQDDESKEESFDSEEGEGAEDSPRSPDPEAQPERNYTDTTPENPGKPVAPENCTFSPYVEYYRCLEEEGEWCLSCEGTVKNLYSGVKGLYNAEGIREKICDARQCCCAGKLEFAVQCAPGAEEFAFQTGDCVNATSLPGDPDGGDSREDSSETGQEDPIELGNPCDDAAEEYDQCILNGGAACLACPMAIFFINITLGTNDCQIIDELIRSAAQCCCRPEVQQIARCYLKEAGSTCESGDFEESPDEKDPEENEPYSCSDLAVIYNQCLANERCFSCINEAEILSQRSFSASPASCRAAHEAICPVSQCCCFDELVALAECSHLEEYGVACEIDCDVYNSMNGRDDPDDKDELNHPPANLPGKCVVANDLYELCVDTSDCSSCKTVDAIARTSLAAIREGQSDYSCDDLNGMVCPAVACCCGQELTELTKCMLEEKIDTCSFGCANDQNGSEKEKCADANDLYELCVDTSECSSCQTVHAIARISLAAIGEGQSDYSCDVINGMVCPAIACCCGQELTELTECMLEENFKTCSFGCTNDQSGCKTENSEQGGNNSNADGVGGDGTRILLHRRASSASAKWRYTEAMIVYQSIAAFVVSGWVFSWSI